MSIYDQLGQQGPHRPDPQREMQSLRADPGAYLKQRGFQIPAGMNNPQQIVQHLMQSGQVGGQRYQAVMQMLRGMRR